MGFAENGVSQGGDGFDRTLGRVRQCTRGGKVRRPSTSRSNCTISCPLTWPTFNAGVCCSTDVHWNAAAVHPYGRRSHGDKLWEGYRESRRCSRDTYPESYITKYTSTRRKHDVRKEGWSVIRYVCKSPQFGTGRNGNRHLSSMHPPNPHDQQLDVGGLVVVSASLHVNPYTAHALSASGNGKGIVQSFRSRRSSILSPL